MTKLQTYKKGLSAFIGSEKGQRFFNFAYSIGAAVVIWGALFKILHLPGGNLLLSLGMGTEVLMFVLTAFDRPPKEYKWEEVFPALKGEEGAEVRGGIGGTVVAGTAGGGSAQGRRAAEMAESLSLDAEQTQSLSDSLAKMAAAAEQLGKMADLATATQQYLSQMEAIAADMEQLHQTTAALNAVSTTLLESYQAITDNSTNIGESTRGYVDQMQALHRNIGGLNAIYELQLRSISSQIDSIDRVNRGVKDIRDMYEKSAAQSARYCEETERMARYMQQLNSIYEKMINAMTVNMFRPMGAGIDGIPVTPEHGVHVNGEAVK